MTKILRNHCGEVRNGKLILHAPDAFTRNMLQFEGKQVQITIDRKKKPRSLSQNAYYWGVVIETLAGEFGYTQDEMHEALKWEFLRKQGSVLPTVRSTADLTTIEFMEYVDKIIRWAAIEYQILIPFPNEEWAFIQPLTTQK